MYYNVCMHVIALNTIFLHTIILLFKEVYVLPNKTYLVTLLVIEESRLWSCREKYIHMCMHSQ